MAYYTLERRVNRRGMPFGLGQVLPDQQLLPPEFTALSPAETIQAANLQVSEATVLDPQVAVPGVTEDGQVGAEQGGRGAETGNGRTTEQQECGWICPVAALAGFGLGLGLLRIATR